MSEKVTLRPTECGKKEEAFPGRRRGSFGMLENRDERHGNGNCRPQCLGKFRGQKTGAALGDERSPPHSRPRGIRASPEPGDSE